MTESLSRQPPEQNPADQPGQPPAEGRDGQDVLPDEEFWRDIPHPPDEPNWLDGSEGGF